MDFSVTAWAVLYVSRKPALFAIDGGCHVLGLTASGAILGAWPPA